MQKCNRSFTVLPDKEEQKVTLALLVFVQAEAHIID